MPRHSPVPEQHSGIATTIHMLDSKLRLLAQRMKVIENNIQVIARTLVNHNKQIKELEQKVEGGGINKEEIVRKVLSEVGSRAGPTGQPDLSGVEEDISALRDEIGRIKAKLEEIEYQVNSINPMEYVTLDQLKDAIESKIEELKK